VSAIEEAADDLLAALRTVEGVWAYSDPGAPVEVPAATVLGPPALTWEAGCGGPTSARWLVYLVVAADETALARLWALLPAVVAAIDALPNAAVIRADPGAYLAGGPELPCYEIQADYAL